MEPDGVVWHGPKVGKKKKHEKYFVFQMSSNMRVSQTETFKVRQKLRPYCVQLWAQQVVRMEKKPIPSMVGFKISRQITKAALAAVKIV